MQRITHIISNHIFIFATSLAMLVHSTWTFGTLFGGQHPTVIHNRPETWIVYLGWVLPALFVALAIDVGQIQTSVRITRARNGKQKFWLSVTFVTLAFAGYYLQWFHLAHHIPSLEFGAGLSEDMRNSLLGLKSIAIFIVPAMLPLSIVLYTLSSETDTITIIQHNDILDEEPKQMIGVTDDGELIFDDEDTQPSEPITDVASSIEPPSPVIKSVTVKQPVTAKKDNTKRCEACNKVMKDAKWNQRYCNAACRQIAYRERQKATA